MSIPERSYVRSYGGAQSGVDSPNLPSLAIALLDPVEKLSGLFLGKHHADITGRNHITIWYTCRVETPSSISNDSGTKRALMLNGEPNKSGPMPKSALNESKCFPNGGHWKNVKQSRRLP